jgi:hypothetical protein
LHCTVVSILFGYDQHGKSGLSKAAISSRKIDSANNKSRAGRRPPVRVSPATACQNQNFDENHPKTTCCHAYAAGNFRIFSNLMSKVKLESDNCGNASAMGGNEPQA